MTTTLTTTAPRRGRPAKTLDNTAVRSWLSSYVSDRREFSQENPRADDVLVGAASLRTAGDTGRGLSVKRLFAVLRSLDTITTAGVSEVLACGKSTAEAYTRAARVASTALAPLVVTGNRGAGYDEFSTDDPYAVDFPWVENSVSGAGFPAQFADQN